MVKNAFDRLHLAELKALDRRIFDTIEGKTQRVANLCSLCKRRLHFFRQVSSDTSDTIFIAVNTTSCDSLRSSPQP